MEINRRQEYAESLADKGNCAGRSRNLIAALWKKEQIDKIYLAGDFGYWLDQDKAVAIDMFSDRLSDRIETIGNSSLEGAIRVLCEKDSMGRLNRIIYISEDILLAEDKEFNAFYMNAMMFED